MREINTEVHKKVLALSSLLQIGDIISSGSIQLDSLLELAVEKASMIFDSGFGILYMPRGDGEDYVARVLYNCQSEGLDGLVLRSGGHNILERALAESAIVVIDKSFKTSKEMEDFKTLYNFKNILVIPIRTGNKNLGLLIIGNNLEEFKYRNDDIDLAKVFAKQITIAIESDLLSKKTEELAIKDDLTGLYNKNYILTRLEEEIKRAVFYQRPCSFILFNIDDFRKFRETRGEIAAEEALKRIAKVIKDDLGPVGKGARISGDEFAMLLPERNKREAAEMAEDVKDKIKSTNLLREGSAYLTVSCGVSENPIDGATSDELFKRARGALERAKATGKNKVVA
jgi:diguanylate cyclase (GGDEF)-like protein